MMTDEQISELTDEETAALIDKLQASMVTRKDEAIIRMKAEWEERAATFGMTPENVLGFDPKRKRAPGIAKYRNPSDPTQTWTGRGKRPGWLKGVDDIEQFRIQEAA